MGSANNVFGRRNEAFPREQPPLMLVEVGLDFGFGLKDRSNLTNERLSAFDKL